LCTIPPAPIYKEEKSMSRPDVLVSADWAEENLNAPGVVFVEVDEDTSAYDGGHLTGAVKLDWKTDLQDSVIRDFVSKEKFEALLSEKGIGNDDTVELNGVEVPLFATLTRNAARATAATGTLLLGGLALTTAAHADTPCPDGARCGTVTAPLDRANPSAGTIDIAYALLQRTDTAVRRSARSSPTPAAPGTPPPRSPPTSRPSRHCGHGATCC